MEVATGGAGYWMVLQLRWVLLGVCVFQYLIKNAALMFLQDVLRNEEECEGDQSRNDDGIIELAQDWDEVGNDVEGHEEISNGNRQEHFGYAWHSLIRPKQFGEEYVLPQLLSDVFEGHGSMVVRIGGLEELVFVK